MKRAIHLFPTFTNIEIIELLRMKDDPLFGLIPPHMTLVFPFESHIPSQILQQYVKNVLNHFSPFFMQLKGVAGTVD